MGTRSPYFTRLLGNEKNSSSDLASALCRSPHPEIWYDSAAFIRWSHPGTIGHHRSQNLDPIK